VVIERRWLAHRPSCDVRGHFDSHLAEILAVSIKNGIGGSPVCLSGGTRIRS
jgi:hypothetical protein